MQTPSTSTNPAWASAAWTREKYEYDMADRMIAASATIRTASRECSRIEGQMGAMYMARRNPEWRMWDTRRGYAANEIIILLRGMREEGYDADAKALGEFLMEKYREMLRGGEKAQFKPVRYVPDGWLKDLNLPEYIELAPRIWSDYRKWRAA